MREKYLPFKKLREAQIPAFGQVEGRMLVTHMQKRTDRLLIGLFVLCLGNESVVLY